MNNFYVYILKCSDNTYYTGYTTNLKNRLNAHNNKKGAKYTRNRLPVEYVFTYKCSSKSEALRLEYKIKKLKKINKEKIIKKELSIDSLISA